MPLLYALPCAFCKSVKTGVAFLPSALPENAGLAFRGEEEWPIAQLSARQAQQLAAAVNRCGRPNHDVLRQRLGFADGESHASWQIDFPAHYTDQEAALYEQPFARLEGTWRNPCVTPDLRRALARLSRYLAMPATAQTPDWVWVEDELLPDASLAVVAREDDFTHGVLSSSAFAAWFDACRRALPLERIVESFPFPWPPATTLNALTATQEESRHAVARAVRDGNSGQLNEAVWKAYGWAPDLSEAEQLEKLHAFHCSRA
jgi:hypothetical protein